MNRKGISLALAAILIGVVAVAASGAVYMNRGKLASITPGEPAEMIREEIDYDGEFDDLYLPEEVTGTDLMVGNITIGPIESIQPTDTDGINATDGGYWFNTSKTPVVDDSEQMVFYDSSESTNITLHKGDNYTVYSYDDGAFNVTSVPAYDSGTGDKLYLTGKNILGAVPYKYQDTSIDAYRKDDDDSFDAYFLVDHKPVSGLDVYLSTTFEVSGPGEDLSIEGKSKTSDFEIREAYLVRDKEGVNMNTDYSVVTGNVDSSDNEFEINKGTISEGEYVLVVKGKAISDLSPGQELFNTIDFDLDGGDVDKGTVKIEVEA